MTDPATGGRRSRCGTSRWMKVYEIARLTIDFLQ
jgi:hypothetical protein